MSKDLREIYINKVLYVAEQELGTVEKPVNNVKYNTEFYGREVSDTAKYKFHWCAVFVWWVFRQAGCLPALRAEKGVFESCNAQWKELKSREITDINKVEPGDLIFIFRNSNSDVPKHMGIVTDVDGDNIHTIEGNTSALGSGGSERNGEGVYRKLHKLSAKCKVARPFWENIETPAIPPVGQPMDDFPLSSGWVFAKSGYQSFNGKGDGYSSYVTLIQQALVIAGYSITVDGAFGNETHNALVSFQRSKGLAADGKVGKMTWNALRAVRDGSSSSSDSSSSYTPFPLPKNHCYGKSGWGNHNGYDGNSDDKYYIKKIQRYLGIDADGLFGKGTHNAVVAFQRSHGLTADGKVGPSTWKAMFG